MSEDSSKYTKKERIGLSALCVVLFVIVTIALFFIFQKYGGDKSISTVMSVISGIIVSWIILSISGLLKEFAIKGPFFEMSSKLQEKISDVKKETEKIRTDVSSINQRIDSVISNQLTATQSQSIKIINRIQEEKRSIAEKIEQKMESHTEKGKVSQEEVTVIPKQVQKQIDSLIEREKELEKLLEKFSSQLPIDINRLLRKANYYYKKMEFSKAEKIYRKILNEEPDNSDVLYNIALSNSKMHNNEKALEYYNVYLEIKPNDADAYANMANNLIKLGKMDEGLALAEKSIKLDDKVHFGWYNKACALALLNNKKEALKALKKAIPILGEPWKEYLKKDSDFDNIRNDPEFQALIKS